MTIDLTMNTDLAGIKIPDSKLARKSRLDLRVFTGFLDKVWVTKSKELVFSMLTLERVDTITGRYTYRTCNTNRGTVKWLKVI